VRRAALLLSLVALTGCRDERVRSSEPPTYDGQVGAIFASRCKDCHDPATAPGRWRGSTYLEAIACVADGKPAAMPAPDGPAPLLRTLQDATHLPILTDDERATVAAWVAAGAPKLSGSVHEASFIDPRSPASHGRLLRSKQWKPMLDPKDPEACGRCHEGVARPEKITSPATGAPACTTCHSDQGGVLACGTCHSDKPTSFPPRDACFFPDDPMRGTAHAAHTAPSPLKAEGLACRTCHELPPPEVIGGAHGNGKVEISFDVNVTGPATWDEQSRSCTSRCHARPGAAKPRPAWTDKGPLACGDCHGAPPPNHFAGACSSCHGEANALGTALTSPRLHVNGKVDLGDGSGKCGACHGKGDDPWPSTGAHATHRAPADAASDDCARCHTVPSAFGPGTGHPVGGAPVVKLAGLAVARNAPATYANGTCTNVYCHGQNLVGTVAASPVWTDTTGKDKKCGSCHGLPPSAPHIATEKCELCHGTVVPSATGPRILPEKRDLHVNGEVNR
jgi:predicted CxxxxCH...CXXCH cytochrome family protein